MAMHEELELSDEETIEQKKTEDARENPAGESKFKMMPAVLSALRERDKIPGQPELPKEISNRIKALKHNQDEALLLEARYHEEVHRLDCKYNRLSAEVFRRREAIVTGRYDPPASECEGYRNPDRGIYSKVTTGNVLDGEGVPCFWLVALKNSRTTGDLIKPQDEPVLKHLSDIGVIYRPADPMGFTLVFRFEANEYFGNYVLTKEYEMRCRPEDASTYGFEGPEIVRTKGCTIDWYSGRNLTVKVVKKRRGRPNQHGRQMSSKVFRVVKNESFFHFFAPPTASIEDPLMDEETYDILAADFEVADHIRRKLVPRAVLYFTGEQSDELEDEEDSEDESSVDESSES